MKLRDYLDERGLTNEDVAAILSEQGITKLKGAQKGEPYSSRDIHNYSQIPRGWEKALGLRSDFSPDSEPGEEGGSSSEPPRVVRRQRSGERPPTAPADAKQYVDAGAQKRIAGVYKFAGAMLATGSGSEGVAAVFSDSSDNIARLWVEAAADNPYAARFVEVMSAGGTLGDLVAAHVYLAGASLYVLGARIPAGDTIFPKYTRYRTVTQPPKPDAASNGGARPEESGVGAAVDDSAAGAMDDG